MKVIIAIVLLVFIIAGFIFLANLKLSKAEC